MASSLPEYQNYMDFMINKRKGETERRGKDTAEADSSLMQILTQSAKDYMRYSPIKVPPFKAAHQKRRKKESRS